jgi:membrane-associated phospholipid phosphatase
MAQQSDLTAEALQRGAMPGRGYAIARRLSQILHPMLLGVASFFIVGFFAIPERLAGLGWAMLCVLLQVVPPTAFFTIRLRQGAYSDEDISVRQQRNELYLFGLLTVLVGLAILFALEAPVPFVALLCSAVVLNILAWLINLVWKISIHSASIGSIATLATIYAAPLGFFFWGCAAALGWARVRTRNHSPLQVMAGLALAVFCVLVVFRGFGLV